MIYKQPCTRADSPPSSPETPSPVYVFLFLLLFKSGAKLVYRKPTTSTRLKMARKH